MPPSIWENGLTELYENDAPSPHISTYGRFQTNVLETTVFYYQNDKQGNFIWKNGVLSL